MTQTLAIKARLANKVRTLLYKKPIDISDKEKLELFQQIYDLNRDVHWELVDYKRKRRRKARIQAERLARGYKPKKKTTLEEYKKNLAVSK